MFAPLGFLPVLCQKGESPQAEFHILLALVYAVGISRLKKYPALFWYCVFAFLLLICVSTEDWSRYFLAMAPLAMGMGYREVLARRPVVGTFLLYGPPPLR